MTDNKICFSGIRGSADIDAVTAPDLAFCGFTADNHRGNTVLLDCLFQLRYYASDRIYNTLSAHDITLPFTACTEHSPLVRQFLIGSHTIAGNEARVHFLPFVHEQPVLYLSPPESADGSEPGYSSAAELLHRIKSGYRELTDSDQPELSHGLVFIRNIEQHLNSGWLPFCIPLLASFFPHTVFYLTTASAVVLSQLTAPQADYRSSAYALHHDEDGIIRTRPCPAAV